MLKSNITMNPFADRRNRPRIAVLSNDSVVRDLVCVILKRRGYRAISASHQAEFEALAAEEDTAVLFVDCRRLCLMGREFAKAHCETKNKKPLVVIMDADDQECISEAMHCGVQAVLTLPFENDAVADIMEVVGVG